MLLICAALKSRTPEGAEGDWRHSLAEARRADSDLLWLIWANLMIFEVKTTLGHLYGAIF